MKIIMNLNNPKANSSPEALKYLKTAILVLDKNQLHPSYKKLLATTFNNIACYYRQ